VHPPAANGAFDYQLGGAYPPPAGTQIVTRDRTARPLADVYSICYVNAFQTQPGDLRWWRAHHRSLLLRRAGREVGDPGWPGEVLLDTSSARKRAGIARVIGRWIDGCARRGFQAVEPDNLDSWTRSHGRLTSVDNFALARRLIRRAHASGLAIGQKNAAEKTTSGRRAGFDFAVAESCQVYDECDAYTDVYGAEVLEIEYADEGGERGFEAACRARGGTISINYRDHDLVTPRDPGYVDRAC
jgi:Glycoside-hydrolase family GH114